MPTRRLAGCFALLAAIALPGCQTLRSWNEGCPGIYSGIRYFADQRDTLPVDGKIFFTLDLPLTAVADTLLLPASAFATPERPKYGFLPGCRWAAAR